MSGGSGGAARAILELLREGDGTFLARKLNLILTHRLSRPVTPHEASAAVDALVADGKVERTPGAGSFVALSGGGHVVPKAANEKRLMPVLAKWLADEDGFARNLSVSHDDFYAWHDTSTSGVATGQWTRPDFTVVHATRLEVLDGCQLDVHSIELKTASGGSVSGVHEALAQTRASHYGHLAWDLPEGSSHESRLDEVYRQCLEHGIGLIRMGGEFEVLADPRRKMPEPRRVDQHLRDALEMTERVRLHDFLGR